MSAKIAGFFVVLTIASGLCAAMLPNGDAAAFLRGVQFASFVAAVVAYVVSINGRK